MAEKRYTVTQAAELTGVKSYVLRYWEEELGLRIGRNEQGHRYYTGYDIQLFLNIKELKKRGLQLRAIKELVPRISRLAPGASADKVKLLDGGSEPVEEKAMSQEKKTCENSEKDSRDHEAKILEFQAILEKLIARGMKERNEEEARCHSLDETIRLHQEARRQAAAAGEPRRRRTRKHKK